MRHRLAGRKRSALLAAIVAGILVASVGVAPSFGADPAQLSVTGKPRAVNNAYGGLAVISGIAAACPDEGVVCTGTSTITGPGAKKSALLGSGPILVSPGISQDVTVTLSKRGLKSLAERGKLKVAISVSLTGPDGQVVTASNGGTIKRLKKKG